MNSQKRIMVVDDEENVLLVLARSLQKLGDEYEIVMARNGHQALAKAQVAPFDLVITDLRMPGMDGIELTKAIHSICPRTEVIWITGYGDKRSRADAQLLGIYRHLDKPLDVAQIRRIAQEALETVRAQEGIASPSVSTDRVQDRLERLQKEAEARCVLLITTSGHVAGSAGHTMGVDISTLSVLLASNFLAAHEIARLLSHQNTFRISYHESDQYKVYAYRVGTDYLLVTVFGRDTRPGVVWLYARRAADELASILDEEGVLGQVHEISGADLEPELVRELDTLFDAPGLFDDALQ